MKKLKILFIVLILFGSISSIGFFYLLKSSVIAKSTEIFIKDGETPVAIWKHLQEQKAIKDDCLLKLVSKIKGFQKTKIGYYKLGKGMSANEVVNILRAGLQSPIKVTFNNIRTLDAFSGRISQQLALDSLELLDKLRDSQLAKDYGFEPFNFISMFIPNTYEMYYTISLKKFLDRMHKEYKQFWNTERKQKLKQLGYTAHEVCTLASIVDEETNKNDEKRRIAGVYINRLKIGIPLQADPTLKFAVGDFSIKRILNKHKEIDSPYNTYKYKGLPRGPIRQPSIVAIDAVLNYERHRFLYFCAKADFSGYHVFSRTLNQHNVNARKYHYALNHRGIMR